MKRLILIAAFILTAGTLAAQNYIIVNSEKVFKSVAAYNKAISDLDELAKQYQEQVDAKFAEVEALYNAYMNQKASLSATTRQTRENAILAREKEAQTFQESLFGNDGALMKKRIEMIEPIQKKVFAAIEAYAKQAGADVVLDSANNPTLLYTNPSVERTQQLIVMGATSLFAQQKFGRINTQEIIVGMPETKEMQTNMEAYAKDLQDNLESMTVEYNQKLQEFQKNFNTLSESVRQLKENDLNALIQRRNEFEQAAQQDFQKRQNELLAPIIEKAKNAIDKVAAAGGYLAVFDTSTGSLAYFDEASLTDIAPAVKKELGITDAPAAAAAPAASK